jgi:DNA repair exonuclease SbcCD ATPase subunit
MYLNEINSIYGKKRLLVSEYTVVKTNLLAPLKATLTEAKNNTTDEHRTTLTTLKHKKQTLTNQITNEQEIIKENERIDTIIFDNKKIDSLNKNIIEQINNYEYHQKVFELEVLEKKKKELTNNILEMTKNYNFSKLTIELQTMEQLHEKLMYNTELDNIILKNQMMLNKLKFMEFSDCINEKTKLSEQQSIILHNFDQQYKLLNICEHKKTINEKINTIKSNKLILKDIEVLNKNIAYEISRQKLIDNKDKLSLISKNVMIKKEVQLMETKLKTFKDDLITKQKEHQLININKNSLESKMEKIIQLREKILIMKNSIDLIENKKKGYINYGELLSPQKLQIMIIRNELKKLECTMNEILSKYTKYNIEIIYDKKSQINITVSNNGKQLRTHLLSAYENLILSTSFKRAIGRHTNISRSHLYIIDESVENMDEENFTKNLPGLLNFILSEYSYVLIVSQRDIKHILCNEIEIVKRNGVSVVL